MEYVGARSENSAGAQPETEAVGDSLIVWGALHPSTPELPFLIDSGASVSLIPYMWYTDIPEDQRPPLRPTHLNVYGGGTNQPIHLAGVVTLDVIIEGHAYEGTFYVAANEVHGILGTVFLRRYYGVLSFGNKHMMLNGRKVTLYDKNGARFNHRVVAAQTMHISPGERFVVTGVVKGRGHIDNQPVIVEAAKSLYTRTGVLVARITARPKYSRIPVELTNLTDETKTIYKNQTLGIVSPAVDARLFEQSAAAEYEKKVLHERVVPSTDCTESANDETHLSDCNRSSTDCEKSVEADAHLSDCNQSSTDSASPRKKKNNLTPPEDFLDGSAHVRELLTEYRRVPRNGGISLNHYDYSSPRMFNVTPEQKREESLREQEQRWTSAAKPFPNYTTCT